MIKRQFFYRRRQGLPIWRVFLDAMLAAIILGLAGAGVLSFSGREVTSRSGQVRVIDGDSLEIGTDKIRLWGIDAPEFKQQCQSRQGPYECGREAQRHLRVLALNATLICKGLGRDRYDRLLAVCRNGNTNINAAMVRGGFAYAYGGYGFEETAARSEKIGIWAADNERPKRFRDRTKASIDLAPGVFDALYQWLVSIYLDED